MRPETMKTVLATFELKNRRGRVLAAFRAEKGEDGQGVVHLVHRDGSLYNSGFTPVSSRHPVEIVIGTARRCADNHLKAYCPTCKVVRVV